jgi:putative ATP-dependent endonuclease of the OLD family
VKVIELLMWRFRCFGSSDPTTDDLSTPHPVKVELDPEITALIGRNGSGKSALLEALQRLFGETREERAVRPEDFFVPPGEMIDSVPKRQMSIEVLLSFPELEAGEKGSEQTVPASFRHMIVDGPDKTPVARIRLEASWQVSTSLDGIIEDNIYWILSSGDVPFGEPEDPTIKKKMSVGDRSLIAVRYIPASRDVTALTRLTVRSLGRSMIQSVLWQNEDKIKKMIKEAGEALDREEAVSRVNQSINSCWSQLNTADTETSARLSILPPDFQHIVRAASIILEPSAIGRTLGIEDLSDGQRSLFHFALVKSLLDFKLGLEAEVAAGKKPPFAANFMRAPALTIFAFEEPENHLAPYFLARLMTELQKLTCTQRVQGVVTSHSPAIVGRLEPLALRHMRLDRATGISRGSPLLLPADTDEASKFVREAVRAHPEIYFARHAVFGEGASEEIVIPRLAEALGVPMDRSFVAIVPIGGRHVEHFWRLVRQLGIPFTTLLDLDLGRSSGDIAQIEAVANAIVSAGPMANTIDQDDLDTALELKRDSPWGAGDDDWNLELIAGWVSFLERQGVYFSFPLDLDMLMLEAFPESYKALPLGAKGPSLAGVPAQQKAAAERVLGEGGFGFVAYEGTPRMRLFPWYAYLFLGNRGKPAVHLGALASLDDATLEAQCPPVLERLIKRIEAALDSPGA